MTNDSWLHLVPDRFQLGRDHHGQPLLAQGLKVGEGAGEEREARLEDRWRAEVRPDSLSTPGEIQG